MDRQIQGYYSLCVVYLSHKKGHRLYRSWIDNTLPGQIMQMLAGQILDRQILA